MRTDMEVAFGVYVIARSEATKQSNSRQRKSGLLRGACHRAALRADPLARNGGGEVGTSARRLVAKIRLDRTMDLDGQRVAKAILGISRGDADPALADAVLLDIGLFDALEANADVARQYLFIIVRAARIDRETVGELV